MMWLQRLVGSILLVGFVCLAVFGLLITAERLEAHGHHGGTESTCPFMPGEQNHCVMNFGDHVNAWQQFLQSSVAAQFVLLVLLVVGFFVLSAVVDLRILYQRTFLINAPPFRNVFFFGTSIQPRAP